MQREQPGDGRDDFVSSVTAYPTVNIPSVPRLFPGCSVPAILSEVPPSRHAIKEAGAPVAEGYGYEGLMSLWCPLRGSAGN
jgi:hypothetical protein